MHAILVTALSNAAMAALLAPLAFGLGRLARRRPALGHTLWLIVLLKLITPSFLAVPVRLPAPRIAAHAEPALAPLDDVPAPRLAVLEHDLAAATDTGPDAMDLADSEARPDRAPAPIASPPPTIPSPGQAVAFDLRRWLLAAWALGSLVWFGLASRRIAGFHRVLGHAKPADEELQRRAEDLARRIGLTRCPRVWVVPIDVSPLLWAVGGPARLVLPARLIGRLGPEEQDALLAHELAHFLRHDHWVRWVELLAMGLYWWHPVAWLARRELERAEEQCCDAWVVWSLPGAAITYAKTLLTTVDFLSETRPALPPAASGAGQVSTLRRRVTMILKEPMNHRLNWPARLLALLLGLVALPLAPWRAGADDKADPARPPAIEKTVVVIQDQDKDKDQAVADADDDDDDDDEDAADNDENERAELRDLNRRLRRLEANLDKLTNSLDPKGQPKAEAGRAPEHARAEAGSHREEARKQREAARRQRDEARKQRDEARGRRDEIEVLTRALDEATRRGDSAAVEMVKKQMDRLKAGNAAADRGVELDRDRLTPGQDDRKAFEELGKQIEALVKEKFDPEKMEKMEKFGKDIEALVKSQVDPEKMEKLAREIEARVKENFDPETVEEFARKMEKFGREMEKQAHTEAQARRNSLKKLRHDEAEAARKIEKEKRGKPGAKPSDDGEARSDREQLERRLDSLENRLNRLIDALEKKDARTQQ